MSNLRRCAAVVFGDTAGYRGTQCSNAARIERDGGWYCGVHDPERGRARAEARAKELGEQARQRALRQAVRDAEANLVAATMDYDDWGMYPLSVNEACHALQRARDAAAPSTPGGPT